MQICIMALVFSQSLRRHSGAEHSRASRALISLVAALLLAFLSAGCTDSEQSGVSTGTPEATIRATSLQDTIVVSVSIPRDHHAYLDKGPQGNLIPVSFDWSPALESGKLAGEPSLTEKPEGEQEEKIGALVLRGTGEFKFSGDSPKPGAEVRVRTQICNDVTGMCFRPTWQTVSIN